jgi:ABC-type nitrate/sulfonate/bicarbonate transport system ATPase subunit
VRALLNQPSLLLLDEPFSALDIASRRKIAQDTRVILRSKNIAAIHVTHDPEEAEIIADRVLLWSEITHSNE